MIWGLEPEAEGILTDKKNSLNKHSTNTNKAY